MFTSNIIIHLRTILVYRIFIVMIEYFPIIRINYLFTKTLSFIVFLFMSLMTWKTWSYMMNDDAYALSIPKKGALKIDKIYLLKLNFSRINCNLFQRKIRQIKILMWEIEFEKVYNIYTLVTLLTIRHCCTFAWVMLYHWKHQIMHIILSFTNIVSLKLSNILFTNVTSLKPLNSIYTSVHKKGTETKLLLCSIE